MSDEQSPLISDLTDWFLSLGKDVADKKRIASKIKSLRTLHLRDEKHITEEHVNRMVTEVRRWLELKHRTTIVNIRNVGYKIANPDELAITTAKWVKRSIMYADRTYRLVDIVDRKKIPNAIREVFGETEGKIKTLSTRGKKFVKAFVEYNQKQIGGGGNAKRS